MQVICTKKNNGARTLVDTAECPNYKEEFNDENGNSFCSKSCAAPAVKAPVAETSFSCGECDKEYKTEAGLENHISNKH